MTEKPSGEPTPRPPETTTSASVSDTPPRCGGDRLRHGHDAIGSRGAVTHRHRLHGVDRLGGNRMRGDREQQRRPDQHGLLEQGAAPAHAGHGAPGRSPAVTATQLAAIGRSSLAATCASTSLPRSLPGAIDRVGAGGQLDQRLRPRRGRERAVHGNRADLAEPERRRRRRRPAGRARRRRRPRSRGSCEHPDLREHRDHGGGGLRAAAEHLGLLARSPRARPDGSCSGGP